MRSNRFQTTLAQAEALVARRGETGVAVPFVDGFCPSPAGIDKSSPHDIAGNRGAPAP
jgi:hypothetical protein